MNNLIDSSKLKGKEFIYKSKYGGEVKGIIKSVLVVYNLMPSELVNVMDNLGLEKGKDPDKLAYTHLAFNSILRKGFYHRPDFKIVSTTGVSYSLIHDEVYIKY